MLAFTLPLGPSVNHLYILTSRGVRLSDDAKKFKADAGLIIRSAANVQGGWLHKANAPLSLYLRLYVPNNRRADISNVIKCTEDAIADALGFDDRHVQRILVERMGVDKVNPRCEVVLEAIL